MAASTSPSLLLRIRDFGDTGAWQEFVDLYSPIVRSYCLQRQLQPSDTDDIVQDVMAMVSRAITKFEYDRSKGKFRSWLGTIAANRIRNHLSQQSIRRSRSYDEEINFDGDSGDTATGECYTDPDTAWVELFSERVFKYACTRIRPELSDIQWRCFEATWMHDQHAATVAKELQLPIHQIYVNKSRVLKKLEAEIRLLAEEIPFSNCIQDDGERAT